MKLTNSPIYNIRVQLLHMHLFPRLKIAMLQIIAARVRPRSEWSGIEVPKLFFSKEYTSSIHLQSVSPVHTKFSCGSKRIKAFCLRVKVNFGFVEKNGPGRIFDRPKNWIEHFVDTKPFDRSAHTELANHRLKKPFASSPGPLYQNEVKRSAFDMEILFHSHANKTHFHNKGCALGSFLTPGYARAYHELLQGQEYANESLAHS